MSSDSFSSLSSDSTSPRAARVAVINVPMSSHLPVSFYVQILPENSLPSSSSSSDSIGMALLPLPTTPTNDDSSLEQNESFAKDGEHLPTLLRTASLSSLNPSGRRTKARHAVTTLKVSQQFRVKTNEQPPVTDNRSPKDDTLPRKAPKRISREKSERAAYLKPVIPRPLPTRPTSVKADEKTPSNHTSQRILESRFRRDFEIAIHLLQITSEEVDFHTFTAVLHTLHFVQGDAQTRKKVATGCWQFLAAEGRVAVERVYGFLSCVLNLGKESDFPAEQAKECRQRFFELYLTHRQWSCRPLSKSDSSRGQSDTSCRTKGRTPRTEDYVYAANLRRKRKVSLESAELRRRAVDSFVKDGVKTQTFAEVIQFWDRL